MDNITDINTSTGRANLENQLDCNSYSAGNRLRRGQKADFGYKYNHLSPAMRRRLGKDRHEKNLKKRMENLNLTVRRPVQEEVSNEVSDMDADELEFQRKIQFYEQARESGNPLRAGIVFASTFSLKLNICEKPSSDLRSIIPEVDSDTDGPCYGDVIPPLVESSSHGSQAKDESELTAAQIKKKEKKRRQKEKKRLERAIKEEEPKKSFKLPAQILKKLKDQPSIELGFYEMGARYALNSKKQAVSLGYHRTSLSEVRGLGFSQKSPVPEQLSRYMEKKLEDTSIELTGLDPDVDENLFSYKVSIPTNNAFSRQKIDLLLSQPDQEVGYEIFSTYDTGENDLLHLGIFSDQQLKRANRNEMLQIRKKGFSIITSDVSQIKVDTIVIVPTRDHFVAANYAHRLKNTQTFEQEYDLLLSHIGHKYHLPYGYGLTEFLNERLKLSVR